MLLVPTEHLVEQDVTATPVPHPQRPGSFLLQKNVSLSASLIKRLGDMGLQWAWIARDGFEDLDSQIGVNMLPIRTQLFEVVGENFQKILKRGICKEDFIALCEAVVKLVSGLYENGGNTGVPSERLFNTEQELFLHSAQVAYLSVTVAKNIQEYMLGQRGAGAASGAAELAALGASAILHDIQKINLDKETRKLHCIDGSENERYLSHPLDAFKMLSGKINTLGGAVCLQHHQKWDGTGWPDMTKITHGRIQGGLGGENIHIYARIVAIANLIDSLTCSQYSETGKILPVIYAQHELQTAEYEGSFDPVILHAFLKHCHAFPVGAEVILSDDRVCGVISQSDDPCRPVVRTLKGETIHLARNMSLHIRKSQGFDVSDWLFPKPAQPAEANMA